MHSRSDSSRRARWFRTERGVACVNQAVGTEYASSKYRKYVGKQLVWHWMGHEIHYRKAGNGPPMILLHGFGAMSGHYRKNVPVLAENFTVYAVDLLGFGDSAKPGGFQYSMEAWQDLVIDFVGDVVEAPVVVVGNSLGSLVSLLVAANAPTGFVRGVVLLNCAGGMNSKFILKLDDWRYKLFAPVFWLFDVIFNNRAIMTRLFDSIRSKEKLQQVLSNVYVNPECVDAELVEMFYKPTEDKNALGTLVNILTGPPGPRPDQVMEDVDVPVCIIWGKEDTVTMIDGPVGEYFIKMSKEFPERVKFTTISSGHCPQDDVPDVVNTTILAFMKSL
eukprot:CAMPEP_0114233146 /NCGR_PEP_ID=MMETSP0058-20121206/4999_1 /TAXON_ID=36894 /ORGANISM="Pyramimonas parkeae, CCMP726" /LENGTH=332 /DNA_ID=CAMNT_0001344697 /DNA_START=208 /DNA_END=1206 /DNA_ORIENTATION=-